MFKRLLLALSLIVMSSQLALADVASLESNYVAGESDLLGHLNRDRTTLTNSVNNVRGCQSGGVQTAGQLKSDTICEENMYDDANPRLYLKELFIANTDGNNGIVANGLEFGTSANLVANLSSGTAYTMGYRINKSSSTAHTFAASKWTYTYVCQDGSLSYDAKTIGTTVTTADYPTNCQPLSRVSTNTTAVFTVTDLRKLKFTLESYDSVYDNALESTLKNLLTANGNSYHSGAVLNYASASTYTVTAGSAMINGKARDRASFTSNASWPVATLTTDDGLDTGVRGNGTYYIYLVADASSQRGYTVVHSTNATTPSGKTNYLKIGEFYTNIGTISQDSVINYTDGSTLLRPTQLVKGWINFNGNGTVSINDSYNVSSITDNAVGDYTVNWTTAFTNNSYAISGTMKDTTNPVGFFMINDTGGLTTTSARLDIRDNSAVKKDFAVITVVATGSR